MSVLMSSSWFVQICTQISLFIQNVGMNFFFCFEFVHEFVFVRKFVCEFCTRNSSFLVELRKSSNKFVKVMLLMACTVMFILWFRPHSSTIGLILELRQPGVSLCGLCFIQKKNADLMFF